MPQRKQLTALQKKALAEKRKAQRAAESDEVRRRRLENDAARRRRRQQTKERGPHDVEPTVKLPLEEPQVLTVLPMPEFLLKQELNEHQEVGSEIVGRTSQFKKSLADWAMECKVPHLHVDKLLKILQPHHPELPLDARTLLATPQKTIAPKKFVTILPKLPQELIIINGM